MLSVASYQLFKAKPEWTGWSFGKNVGSAVGRRALGRVTSD